MIANTALGTCWVAGLDCASQLQYAETPLFRALQNQRSACLHVQSASAQICRDRHDTPSFRFAAIPTVECTVE